MCKGYTSQSCMSIGVHVCVCVCICYKYSGTIIDVNVQN